MIINFALLIMTSHLVVSSSILLNDLSTEGTAKETQLPMKGVDDTSIDDDAGVTAEGEKDTRETKDSTGELPLIAIFIIIGAFQFLQSFFVL